MKKKLSRDVSTLKDLTVEQVEKMDDAELEQLVEKKKSRPKRRKMTGKLGLLISVITVSMSCFHLYAAIFTMSPMMQRAIHLGFVLPLIFLLYPATSKSPTHRPSVLDCILAIVLEMSRNVQSGNTQNLKSSAAPVRLPSAPAPTPGTSQAAAPAGCAYRS